MPHVRAHTFLFAHPWPEENVLVCVRARAACLCTLMLRASIVDMCVDRHSPSSHMMLTTLPLL